MAQMIENQKKLTENFEVSSYDSDKQQNIKISGLQRWFQRAADEHCTFFGCDYNTMREKMDIVFVLVKTSINVFHPIKLSEKFTVTTWHKGSKGVQFFRDYTVTDEKGKVYAEGGTSWVIVDPKTHKMKRPGEIRFPLVECGESVDTTRLEKIHMPELEYVGNKKVRYTEVDVNNHLTNWVYADIVTNYLPDMNGKRVAEMDISYISEAYENEVIRISRAFKDGVYFFRGEHSRGKCFEARCRVVQSN